MFHAEVDAGLWLRGKHCQILVLVDRVCSQRGDPVGGEFRGQELLVDNNVADVCFGQGGKFGT